MLGAVGAARGGPSGSYEAWLLMKFILEFTEAKQNPKSTLDYRKAKLSTTVSKLKPKLVLQLQQKLSRLTETESDENDVIVISRGQSQDYVTAFRSVGLS